MTVIDKILLEWSYRCHDGIVDVNDPKKKAILKFCFKQICSMKVIKVNH
jgi:hypothetical protein